MQELPSGFDFHHSSIQEKTIWPDVVPFAGSRTTRASLASASSELRQFSCISSSSSPVPPAAVVFQASEPNSVTISGLPLPERKVEKASSNVQPR